MEKKAPAGMSHRKPMLKKMGMSFLVERKAPAGMMSQETHALKKEVSFLAGKKAPAGMSHGKPMLKKRGCRFWWEKNLRVCVTGNPCLNKRMCLLVEKNPCGHESQETHAFIKISIVKFYKTPEDATHRKPMFL